MKIIKVLTYLLFFMAILIVACVVLKAIYSALEMIAMRNFIWEIMAYELQIV